VEPLEITITHNLDDKAEVSTLFERKWLALSWERKGADPKYYEGRGKRDVLLFHEMRQRGAAVVAAYKSATPKSPGARVVGIVLPDSPFEELNGMPCLSLANAQIYDASRSFLGNLVPRQSTVQNCGMRARGRLRNLAFGTQSVPSVYSLHHLDVEWLVTNYLIMTGICAAIWSGGRTYEHIDHVGLTLEGNELVAQTTISPNLVAEKAARMCDAQNRLAILISAPKINTLDGCEYPAASSSHSDHLSASGYNRGVSLTT
jgi:hypothetical protein